MKIKRPKSFSISQTALTSVRSQQPNIVQCPNFGYFHSKYHPIAKSEQQSKYDDLPNFDQKNYPDSAGNHGAEPVVILG